MKRLKVGAIDALLPAMWRRTSKAVNNLTAIGLASLLPGSNDVEIAVGECGDDGNENSEPDTSVKDQMPSSLGRKHFAHRLLKVAKESSGINKVSNEAENDLLRKAIEVDLNGE